MQNGRQIDLSAQVERVKRKTRPWKSIIALLLAIAAAVISHRASHGRSTFFHSSDLTNQFVIYGTAVLFLVFGCSATYGLAGKSRELLEPKAGPAYAAIVRYAILIVGAFTTLVITLLLFGVDVSKLVLAQEDGPPRSWWEAIPVEKAGDAFKLRWRDYATIPPISRDRFALALVCPDTA